MDRAKLNELLEGGYIEAYAFNLRAGNVQFRVDVMSREQLKSYDLHLEKVSRVVYDTEQSWFGSDYRLQVTEISVNEAPESSGSEEWQLSISIWDLAHLTIWCSSVLIDGESLR